MAIPTISLEELRQLLDRGAPVAVLDVRPAAERAEWSIPGSVHIDAYDALRRGDPGALADFRPATAGPVVTVCTEGKTSLLAAERLLARGLDAVSLSGGMRAWSLAWNTAEVPIPGSSAQVVQVRRTGKGCLSYIVGSGGEAVVIDPSLDPQTYRELAGLRGWRIGTVIETHVHADHLSRARALAAESGAALRLPATDRGSFAYEPLRNGDAVSVGSAHLRAWHTPGHTPESTCYLLDVLALFTGDTLFLGSVGRPDLEATPDETRARTHRLHASLRRLAELPDDTVVLPGHTGAPVAFDGRPLVSRLRVVRERTQLLRVEESAFVTAVLERIPPTPPNHHRIVALNETGTLPEGDPTELEAGANRCAIA